MGWARELGVPRLDFAVSSVEGILPDNGIRAVTDLDYIGVAEFADKIVADSAVYRSDTRRNHAVLDRQDLTVPGQIVFLDQLTDLDQVEAFVPFTSVVVKLFQCCDLDTVRADVRIELLHPQFHAALLVLLKNIVL